MKDVFAFIEKARMQIAVKGEFPYWKLLEELEEFSGKFPDLWKGRTEGNVEIKGKLCLGKGSVVKNGSVIEGNVFVGENCVIGPNAFLRGPVIIADNCHIGSSEIKNSLVLAGSNAPHYSYIGDSIIGEKVNFGAGAKVANLRFDEKNVSVGISGKLYDSGRRKLGALVKSGTKIGINASIDCGVIVGMNCFIFPGAVVSKNLADGEKFRG